MHTYCTAAHTLSMASFQKEIKKIFNGKGFYEKMLIVIYQKCFSLFIEKLNFVTKSLLLFI